MRKKLKNHMRVVSILMSLSIALSQINITEVKMISASAAKISVGSVNIEQERQIDLSVILSADSQVTNGKLTISYDCSKLKLDQAKSGAALEGTTALVNSKEEGKIILGFISVTEISAGGSMLDLKFTVTDPDFKTLPITVKVDEFVGMGAEGNNKDIEVEAVDGSITVQKEEKNAQPVKLQVSEGKTDNDGKSDISVTLGADSKVTNGKLTISYDSSKLKLEQAKTGAALEGATALINSKEEGKIILGFMSVSEIVAGCSMLDLKFTATGKTGEVVPLTLSADEFVGMDAQGKDRNIVVEAVNGSVSITSVSGDNKYDINSDGKVDVLDLLVLKKCCLGQEVSEIAKVKCDLNQNSVADVFDVIRLKKAILKI